MMRGPGGGPTLEEARIIGDGIAYLRFNALANDPEVARQARAFLLEHADARAVIIDSRPNRGGTRMVMDAILPLFYREQTTLLRMDTRRDAAALLGSDDTPTMVPQPAEDGVLRRDHIVIPDTTETRLFDVPLYYLTSKGTGSAGEHLALALKRTGRATLIGETTYGAGHFGMPVQAGRFGIFIPSGRTYDPDTGAGWEATGVAPHVPVPADAALDKALEMIATEGRS